MSDQFVAEIRIFPFNFAPKGWAMCNGQLLPISQNTALFSLLGTMYGGDGRSTFALPNLQGSAPMNQGAGPNLTQRTMGESGGSPSVTLLSTEMPSHTHTVMNAAASNATVPATNTVFGGGGRDKESAYAPASQPASVLMNPLAVGIAGGSQPHNNMPPYLALNFVIALQ